MSRGTVVYGTCPRCFTEQPLIWDGCIRPHQAPGEDHLFGRRSCPGSMHVPADAEPRPAHVHRCSCGVTFEETNQ